MNDKNKNLVWRVVTALVLLPIILWLLWKGGVYASALLGVAAFICAVEYYQIIGARLDLSSLLGAGLAAFLPVAAAVWPPISVHLSAAAVGSFFLFAWAYVLFWGPHAEGPARVGHLLSGALLGGFGMAAMAYLRLSTDGFGWVVVALAVTWGNDTLAYFAGRFFGKRKLYPAISPNKTWEGFAGGLCGSIVALFIVRLVAFPTLSVVDCLVVGTLGGIFGPIGDLSESMLKRAHQVKDSGKLIPGHGGLLDRIDALLFNAPLILMYVKLFHGAL